MSSICQSGALPSSLLSKYLAASPYSGSKSVFKVTMTQQVALCSDDWHMGYKRAFDLFPKGLQKRIMAERKKRLDQEQRPALAKATAEYSSLSKEYAKRVSYSEYGRHCRANEKLVKQKGDKFFCF